MTTAAAQRDTSQQEEAVTVSGYGFRMVINGHDKPQIFNDKDELVVDVNERMVAQEKLVLPLVQKLGTSWNRELADLAAATQKVTTMSANVQGAFAATNDNQKKPQLGDQMPDTSYYMGVSEDTGTDFYLFIESVGQSKTADVVTFNKGTEILRKKHKNNETFHGHKFSEFQLESEIIQAQQEGKADGGNRRLTKKEQAQAWKVMKDTGLLTQALEVCSKDPWVQSASPYDDRSAWLQYLRDGRQDFYGRRNLDASLLVGRSDSQPKVG